MDWAILWGVGAIVAGVAIIAAPVVVLIGGLWAAYTLDAPLRRQGKVYYWTAQFLLTLLILGSTYATWRFMQALVDWISPPR